MRLVDAEPIEKFITDGLNNQEKSYGWVGVEILTEVHYAPTVDVAPVVHAHWIYKFQDSQCYYVYECSSCKRFERLQFTDDLKTMPYCHCGAKMDGEVKKK